MFNERYIKAIMKKNLRVHFAVFCKLGEDEAFAEVSLLIDDMLPKIKK